MIKKLQNQLVQTVLNSTERERVQAGKMLKSFGRRFGEWLCFYAGKASFRYRNLLTGIRTEKSQYFRKRY